MDQISPLKKHTRPLLAVRAHQPGRLSRAATIFLAQKGRGECSSGAVRRNETRNTHKNTRGRGRRPLLPFFFRPRPPTLKPPPPFMPTHSGTPRGARARGRERDRSDNAPPVLSLSARPSHFGTRRRRALENDPQGGAPDAPRFLFLLTYQPLAWPAVCPPLPPPLPSRSSPHRLLRRGARLLARLCAASPGRGGECVRGRGGRQTQRATVCVRVRVCFSKSPSAIETKVNTISRFRFREPSVRSREASACRERGTDPPVTRRGGGRPTSRSSSNRIEIADRSVQRRCRIGIVNPRDHNHIIADHPSSIPQLTSSHCLALSRPRDQARTQQNLYSARRRPPPLSRQPQTQRRAGRVGRRRPH